MIGIAEPLLVQRLRKMGLPGRLTDGPKGIYLAVFLGRKKVPVNVAADRAGVSSAAVRVWRTRDEEFRLAERAVRTKTDFRQPEPEPEPKSEEIEFLYCRLEAALKITDHLGVGPWPGTRFAAEQMTGQYTQARRTAIETISDLRALGETVNHREPPPPVPYPRQRGRRGDFQLALTKGTW